MQALYSYKIPMYYVIKNKMIYLCVCLSLVVLEEIYIRAKMVSLAVFKCNCFMGIRKHKSSQLMSPFSSTYS